MSASPLPQHQTPPTDAIAVVETPAAPALIAQSPAAQVISVKTELSFCLLTSLAFFKDLTWEQTPWIYHHTTSRTTISPIIPAGADSISSFFVNHDISQEAVGNALFFGSSATGIDLFIIFPYAGEDPNPATDERFLNIWHDQIVKPAFDRAWKDSGLIPIHGAEVHPMTPIMKPSGAHTDMEALPAKGFIKRLTNGSPGSVSTDWPNNKQEVLNEAWLDITGMLKDHPDLADFQDPRLLAVYRAEIHLGEHMSYSEQYRTVCKEWKPLANGEYIEPGTFGVVLETIARQAKAEEDVEAPLTLEGETQPKRRSHEGYGLEHHEDDDEHRNKRRK
jgi:hypothetical protein